MKKLLIVLITLIHTAHATQIIDISSDDSCWELETHYNRTLKASHLHCAIECFNNDRAPTTLERVVDLTATEARQFLYHNVQNNITNSNLNIEDFFTNNFFGIKPCDADLHESIEDIINNDLDNLLSVISDLYEYSSTHDVRRLTARLSLKTLLVAPEQLYEALRRDKRFSDITWQHLDFQSFIHTYPNTAQFYSSKYFGIPDDLNERHKHFLNNELGWFTKDLLKDTVDYAQKLMLHSRQGDSFVIFGNTPYFVGRLLRFLCSIDKTANNYRCVIDFAFSGTPNTKRLEEDDIANQNLVTPARLAHLMKRLQAAGLLDENPQHTIHFIDAVVTGGGIAYVMKQILRHYQDQTVKPNFHIFCLNKICPLSIHSKIIEHDNDSLGKKVDARYIINGKTVCFQEYVFTFPSKHTPEFKIPATFIKNPRICFPFGHLPHNDWRVFPDYNACYWQDQYNYLLTNDLPPHIKSLLEYVDINIQQILKKDSL